MATEADVSVVIPTVGRPSLYGAIESVLAQTAIPREILICADTTRDLEMPESSRLRVIRVGPGLGGNAARAAGVLQASSSLIALLDDDDEWEPGRLETQLAEVPLDERLWIATCRATVVVDGHMTTLLPERPIPVPTAQGALDYLFRVNSVRHDHPFIQASTLLFPRDLALRVPFDSTLRFHQDISWLIDVATVVPSTRIVQVWSPLVRYAEVGGSVSRGIEAMESAQWASERLLPLSRRLFGDFVLVQSMHFARLRLSLGDSLRVAAFALRWGSPGLPAAVLAIATIVRLPFWVLAEKLGRRRDQDAAR